MSKTIEELAAAYEKQKTYTVSVNAAEEGSLAIALGRAAGLAKQIGNDVDAVRFWNELVKLTGKRPTEVDDMPTLDAMYAAYQKRTDKFAEFADKDVFTHSAGLDFSNAMGSYAFALDYMYRGSDATKKGGDHDPIKYYGSAALSAAGFDKAVEVMDAVSLPAERFSASDDKTNIKFRG